MEAFDADGLQNFVKTRTNVKNNKCLLNFGIEAVHLLPYDLCICFNSRLS